MAGPDMGVARRDAVPLSGPPSLDPLLERIGEAHFVLVGEASHGTTEYYRWRARLTERLIDEKGFSFVAVEGDWSDCQALHAAVTETADAPAGPQQILECHRRWPAWMWANTDVLDFAQWLRRHNEGRPSRCRVGFFGLDVYSLWDSLHALLGYLGEYAPEYVDQALNACLCFEPYDQDLHADARSTRLVPAGREAEVVDLLTELRRDQWTAPPGRHLEKFAAQQNAEVLLGAGRYYRAMVGGGPQAWNARDHHMADTLDRLTAYHGEQAKAVVWAHNTHIGDTRGTGMASAGMVSLGQWVRERHGADETVLVGFGSHSGTVIAAEHWEGSARVMEVPSAKAGGVEDLLHESRTGDALFVVPPEEFRPGWLRKELAHRAIGVVYRPDRPDRESWGNYVPTVLGQAYDALLYFDRTNALTPLHSHEPGARDRETFPHGL